MLINLIKNAIESFGKQEDRLIKLQAFHKNKSDFIKIEDNGNGVPEEQLDQLFIPFFTTKKNGSGIGLSISKQVMRLHKGSIQIKSKQGKGILYSYLI